MAVHAKPTRTRRAGRLLAAFAHDGLAIGHALTVLGWVALAVAAGPTATELAAEQGLARETVTFVLLTIAAPIFGAVRVRDMVRRLHKVTRGRG